MVAVEAERSRIPDDAARERDLVPWLLVIVDAIVLAVVWAWVVHIGWQLVGDDAVIVLRGADVFSRNPPLIGLPSQFSHWSQEARPFHLGPTPFWVLAPATGLLGPTVHATLLTTYANALACVALTGLVAKKVGGPTAAEAAVVLTMLMQAMLISPQLWSPLTPIPATLQLLLLCFLSWAIAAGHLRWWPVWAGVATLVVQADLSFAPTTAGLGVVVLGSTCARLLRHRGPERGRRWTLLATAGVLAVGWASVLFEAAAYGGGNLAEIWRASRVDLPVAGLPRAGSTLLYVLTARTAFPETPFELIDVALIVSLAASLALGAHAWRRGIRRPGLAATAVAGLLGSLVGQVLTPQAAGVERLYLLGLDASAVFAWFAVVVWASDGLREATGPGASATSRRLGWSAAGTALTMPVLVVGAPLLAAYALGAIVIAAARGRRSAVELRFPALRRAKPLVAIPIAVAMGLLVTSTLSAQDLYLAHTFDAIEPLTDQVDDLPDGGYRWFPLGGPEATSFVHGLAVSASARGIEPRVYPSLADYLGTHRLADGTERGTLIVTFGGGGAPTPGARRIASWRGPGDRAAQAELIDQVAAAARRGPIEIDNRTSSYFIGTVVAGTGAVDIPIGAEGPTNAALLDLGATYLEDPAKIAALPDVTIAALVDQGLIRVPGPSIRFGSLGTSSTIQVWLAPTPDP